MFRKRRVQISLILLAISCGGSTAFAQDKNYGFFFHPEARRFFSSKEALFTIRSISDQEYVEKIQVSLDGKSWENYSGGLSFGEEGLHYIRFRAVDPVLNWSPVQTFKVFVDLTPPISVPDWQGKTHDGESGLFVRPASRLSISSADNLSGVSRVVWEKNGKESRFKGYAVFKQPGEHEIRFRAKDHVGNWEPWKTHRFTVDGKAPKSSAQSEGTFHITKSKIFVNSGTHIVLDAKDDVSGVDRIEYKINDGPVTKYRNPIPVYQPTIKLSYRAVDFVGNSESWKNYTVFQDIAPPEIKTNKIGRHIENRGKIFAKPGFAVHVTSTDVGSGISEFKVTQDGGNFDPAKQGKFTFREPGEYIFSARARDRVGNQIESNPKIVAIDRTAPKTVLDSTDDLVEKGGVFLSAIPNKLILTAKDNLSGVSHIEYSYDGKKYEKVTGPIDLAQWSRSRRTFYYRSVDRLGNQEKTNKIVIMVKTTGPKVDLFVEAKDLPKVPLSTLKGRIIKNSTKKATEKKLKKRKPAGNKKVKKSSKSKTKKSKKAKKSKKKSKKKNAKKSKKKKGKKK